MSKSGKILLIIAAILLGIFLLAVRPAIKSYNNMVTFEEDINGKWSQVTTDYQRRMDLIPNLVNTVKGYADFEKETLTAVVEARAK
ncbi:MAG: LemA family protein, partial [Bacteroidetes bacterium]|nr:LemA family protein [Bacteroidota bacterium]